LGFVPRNYLDYLAPSAERQGLPRGTPAEVERFMEDVRLCREAARNAVAKAQVKQAEAYNTRCRMISFKDDDWVLVNPHSLEWIESGDKGVKLVQRWTGPFQVQERINENTYRLRMSNKYTDVPVFNLEHLRPYHQSPAEFGERAVLPDTRLHMTEIEEAEVESIQDHKYDQRSWDWRYRVRFRNSPPDEDTWLPAGGLKNAPALLRRYRWEHGL
jgi:hypothetical protein